MLAGIRELKRRYTIAVAMGEVLPTWDRGVPVPLSTGRPLFDAALTDALVTTATRTEAEHVAQAWQMVREATDREVAILAKHARLLLNDYKLLLALRCWETGDEQNARHFLAAMPWGARLGFPTAVIKPAARVFSGWRRTIRFRLVGDPRFDALRLLYRELLAKAPPVAILKYRAAIQEASALLHFRFEGERERHIHDWCFGDGSSLESATSMEPLSTYVRARSALRSGGVDAMARVLAGSEANVSVTSVMGLIGSAGVRLGEASPAGGALRDYVVRCSSAVEALLRLAEWAPWLTKAHAAEIGRRVTDAVSDDGLGIPYHRVLRAFAAAPDRARRLTAEPMLLPVLRAFGARAAALLPPPGPVSCVQLGSVPHGTTLTVAAAIADATESRLWMVLSDATEEAPIPGIEEVAERLADGRREFDQWMLDLYAESVDRHSWHYDLSGLHAALANLDPAAPLLMDVPAWRDARTLTALMPFDRILCMQAPIGVPGEVSVLSGHYMQPLLRRSRGRNVMAGYADGSAARLAETLDAIGRFQTLAAESEALASEAGPQ
jgi:hypothetical protein